MTDNPMAPGLELADVIWYSTARLRNETNDGYTPFFTRPWVEIFRLSFRELREIKMWSKSEQKIITIATPETKHSKNHP